MKDSEPAPSAYSAAGAAASRLRRDVGAATSMMKRLTIILLLCAAGCSKTDEAAPQEPKAVQQARAYVKSWNHMGMYLPDDQVSFFAANYASVTGVLAEH